MKFLFIKKIIKLKKIDIAKLIEEYQNFKLKIMQLQNTKNVLKNDFESEKTTKDSIFTYQEYFLKNITYRREINKKILNLENQAILLKEEILSHFFNIKKFEKLLSIKQEQRTRNKKLLISKNDKQVQNLINNHKL